jgi:hypothetical protein
MQQILALPAWLAVAAAGLHPSQRSLQGVELLVGMAVVLTLITLLQLIPLARANRQFLEASLS